ncbi:MAG: hypothetical protein RIF34_06165, partial [Candidatus Kapaibacterium sp.]
MLKYISIILIFTAFTLFSQTNYSISGTVLDIEGLPQIGASVALHNPKDSSIITGASTKIGGNFKFTAREGNY